MENGLGLSLKLKLGNGDESSNLSHPFTESSFDYGRHFSSKRRVGDNNFMLNSVDRRPFGFPLEGRYPSEGSSSHQGPNTTLKLGNPSWNMNARLRGLNQDPNVLAPKLDLLDVKGRRVVAEREAVVIDMEGGEKKKLRLSKEQCTVLEQTFLERSTLNNKEKRNLATQLGLKPRQVEVWFQNRRARTKLKQTEVDRLFLKKYCQELSDENKRLQKQVQELRSQRFKAGFLGDVDDQESQPESSVSVGHFAKMGD